MPVRARLADISGVAGSGALLGSVFLPWVRRGAGSTLRGHDLVDTLVTVGRDGPGLSGARLTVLWYLVPAMGAIGWIVIGRAGVESRAARVHAVVTAVIVGATLLAFSWLAGAGDLGIGAWFAAAGTIALVAATWTGSVARKRAGRAVRDHSV